MKHKCIDCGEEFEESNMSECDYSGSDEWVCENCKDDGD